MSWVGRNGEGCITYIHTHTRLTYRIFSKIDQYAHIPISLLSLYTYTYMCVHRTPCDLPACYPIGLVAVEGQYTTSYLIPVCVWLEENRKPGTCTGDSNFLLCVRHISPARHPTPKVDQQTEHWYH